MTHAELSAVAYDARCWYFFFKFAFLFLWKHLGVYTRKLR